jgi:hypothetical protein
MPISPEEICRKLGEDKTRAIFHELTSEAMKKVLKEARIPTNRLASHTSTKRRNEDWSNKVWLKLASQPVSTTAATLLFEWLTRSRRPMLADFLDGLSIPHEAGLTDADFMKDSPPEKLVESAEKILGKHDKKEAAAYLLFLDASNKSDVFAALELEKHLGTA